MVSDHSFLCPTCRRYTSQQRNSKCKNCFGKPASSISPVKYQPSLNIVGKTGANGKNTKERKVEIKNRKSQFSFLSVLILLSFILAAFNSYNKGGDAELIKVAIIFTIGILVLYVVGKIFGSKDPEKTFEDVIVSGMMRFVLLMFFLGIPFFILKMLGFIDPNSGCSGSRAVYEEWCEPDPDVPSFKWLD